jgi:hypothetical protein
MGLFEIRESVWGSVLPEEWNNGMNVNVSDDVASVFFVGSSKRLQEIRVIPQHIKIEALLLNQRHSHITLLLTLRNLFFVLRNSLSSSGRSYLKDRAGTSDNKRVVLYPFSRLELANCIPVWFRCWFLPANFTRQEE